MAGRSGFPRRFPTSKSRRLTDWGIGPEARDGSLGSTTSVLWSTGVTPTVGKVTIVRTRGGIGLTLTTAGAVGDGFFGAVGIGIVAVPAFTAGIASVPTPLIESDWDGWLWHQFFDIRSVTATIADGVNAVGCRKWIDIDSKAMRIVEGDEVVFGVVEGVESGTAFMEFHADSRLLAKT